MIPKALLTQTVIDTAQAEWARDIRDSRKYPDSMARIDEYIRTDVGLLWSWLPPYAKDGDYQWCGAFAAVCWRAAGLHQEIAKYAFSSTYRLDRWAAYRQPVAKWAGQQVKIPQTAAEVHQELSPFVDKTVHVQDLHQAIGALRKHIRVADANNVPEISAGDILLVGKKSTPTRQRQAYGGHVTIAAGPVDAVGYVPTYEGNATGIGPSGACREGVIRHLRPLGGALQGYVIKVVIRPSWIDTVATLKYV